MINHPSGECSGSSIKRLGVLEWPPRSADSAIQGFSFRDTSSKRFGVYLNHNSQSLDNSERVQKHADSFGTKRI